MNGYFIHKNVFKENDSTFQFNFSKPRNLSSLPSHVDFNIPVIKTIFNYTRFFLLFFHSFRVDFQYPAWRIRHTNHSQLLMGIAQTVEELLQNKKNQLKLSKTWEKPVMNFAEWIDLSFLFLSLPNCTSSFQPTKWKRQTAMRKSEMVRLHLQFHISRIFRKQSFGLDKCRDGWPCWGSSYAGASA